MASLVKTLRNIGNLLLTAVKFRAKENCGEKKAKENEV